jgi:PadR family transcriptional regulator
MSEPHTAGNHHDVVVNARPTGWLSTVALVTLREQSSYGYELMERLKEFGFEEINPGTLYRTLRQMENEGLCKSEWDTSEGRTGPARRMYSVTEAGEAYLDIWAENCKRYQQLMDAFFLTYATRQPKT